MDILIFIPTYNRPDMCLRLLKQIKEQQGDHDITILLVNDRSTKNYKDVRLFLYHQFKKGYIDTPEHHGKAKFWKTVNIGFQQASLYTWDYFFMIGDDLELTPNFFNKAIELFTSIKDIICLNLNYEYARSKTKMWTNVEPKIVNNDLLSTGWVDMCFVAERKFLNLLNNTIHEVPASWAADPTRSSGVGMQISKRIVEAGYVFHQVRKSLVIHGDHHSMMHPEERKKHPLISNHETNSPETKTASLAAMPAREKQLQQVIKSLLPQVDRINVYLNEWQQTPDFLTNKKITVFRSQDEAGDLGDVGKFYQCEKVRGYHFTCDDDLLYPADYVKTLINAIEKRSRKAVVSFHGRSFDQFPITSYYNGHASAISCRKDCDQDTPAHVLGTGVLGYHTDTMKITLADFKAINMGDIWFSIQAELQNIPRVVLKHEAGWIQYLKVPFADTIAGWHHNNEAVQVEAMNSIKWKPLKIEYTMNTLRPDVARKYYVPTIKPGKYNFKDFGDIDLCQITLEQADALFAKNFPFLKLKRPGSAKFAEQKKSEPPATTAPATAAPIEETETMPDARGEVTDYRKNKGYVNKLLTMNWENLNFKEKQIFYDSQAVFLQKKQALFYISEIDRRMNSLHAKMRAQPNTAAGSRKRAELLEQLQNADDERKSHWSVIDDWAKPTNKQITEKEKIEKAKKEALATQKRILANNNYIYRYEDAVDDPKLSEKRRKHLKTEVERRKQELIDMGAPYSRKTRKK
jgi:hypothetical protein